jgi:hypothetical protein
LSRRTTSALTLLALAAVATGGVASAGDDGGSGDRTDAKGAGVEFAYFEGEPVGGLVMAVRRPGRARAAVLGSLNDLPGAVRGKRYLVVATTKPCAQRLAGDFNSDGDVNIADLIVWRTSIIMANTEGDFHFRASPRLERPRARTRSIRIYDRGEDGRVRGRDCVRATSVPGSRSSSRGSNAVAAHNRAFANSVTVAQVKPLAPGLDRYSGKVHSRKLRCQRRREVQVYRADVNPEVRLFTTRTGRRGGWLRKGPSMPVGAKVYALIETRVLPGGGAHDHTCPVDRSPVRTTPYP